MKKAIALMLCIICVLSFVACSSSEEQNDSTEEQGDPKESIISTFVDQYNANSDEKLVYVEDFTPSDKSSSHYRTEFRLSAYSDAVGKSYSLEGTTVDIVASQGSISKEVSYRVYMVSDSLEQVITVVSIASPIMDETMSQDEFQETIDYLSENKEANGYYYGKLGLCLLGNDKKGYDLMIKTD